MRFRSLSLAIALFAAPLVAEAQPFEGIYIGAGAGYNLPQNYPLAGGGAFQPLVGGATFQPMAGGGSLHPQLHPCPVHAHRGEWVHGHLGYASV